MPVTAAELLMRVSAAARAQLVPGQVSAADFDAVFAKLQPSLVAELGSKLARLPWGGWLRRDELPTWAGARVRVVRDDGRGLAGLDGSILEVLRGGLKARVRVGQRSIIFAARDLELIGSERAATDPDPKPTTVAARVKANIAALEVLAAHPGPYSPRETTVLRRYTGFGGLSLKKVLPLWPSSLPPPSDRGLIDEYYTPELLAAAIAGLVTTRLDALVDQNGEVLALDPAAGIGRLMLEDPRIRWTAVEYAANSAQILRAFHPQATVYNQPFEEFFADRGQEYYQRVGLVLANPPYSDNRGPSEKLDPDRSTRRLSAAQYFLYRGVEILKPGGLAIFIVPHSILSGPNYSAFRASLLRRAHLGAAFRLPSDLFPGAHLVVDVLVLRARGGQLPEVAEDDKFIVAGDYFKSNPSHVLGTEVVGGGVRRAYQVTGEFTGFPAFVERIACECPAAPFPRPWLRSAFERRLEEEELSPETLRARSLGARVNEFTRRQGLGEDLDVGAWQVIATQLAEWLRNFGNPWQHPEIKQLVARDLNVARFAGLFTQRGTLATEWIVAPKLELRFQPRDLLEVAEYLWQRNRRVTLKRLLDAHAQANLGVLEAPQAADILERANWAIDFADAPANRFQTRSSLTETERTVMPLKHYLAGDLWLRVDRARGETGDLASLAQRQLSQLLAEIAPVPFGALEVSPKFRWIPTAMLSEWMTAAFERPVNLVVDPETGLYSDAGDEDTEEEDDNINDVGDEDDTAKPSARTKKRRNKKRLFLGYLNDDYREFSPDGRHFAEAYGIDADKYNADENTARPSLTQAVRLRMAETWATEFGAWLALEDERRDYYAEGWNRTFKGWKVPEYPREITMPVGWSTAIKPNWWQVEGASRMADQRGGLCAFDVGLGKTLTAILLIAMGKERGLMRRPVIVVPNSVTWQWVAEITRAMPNFVVGVIGSKLHAKPDGKIADRNDEPEERAAKWTAFQLGLYDVVIVTATAFPRVAVNTEALEPVYREMTDFLRLAYDTKEALKAKRKMLMAQQGGVIAPADNSPGDDEAEAADEDDDDAQKKPPKKWTERDEQRMLQDFGSFLAELNELPPGRRSDPGIIWNDLGVDALIVDEAQWYKGLFMPPAIDGSVPKFMGSSQESSHRAWHMHARATAVLAAHGDTGVYLLSATPAKNSPLEIYNALSYVSMNVWRARGISTHLGFVDRYCRFDFVTTLSTKLEPQGKHALVGFSHLDELRAVIFEKSTFYTAEQVKLALPEADVCPIKVAMSVRQTALYELEILNLEIAIKGRKKGEIFRALANMSLIATHPDLIDRVTKRLRGKAALKVAFKEVAAWNWANALTNPRFRSPKFDRCAAQIMAQTNCSHLVFLQNVAAQRWFCETLVAAGFPREQIGIMNGKTAARPAARRTLALAFTGTPPTPEGDVEVPPTYRVMIANEVAHEGVNLQTVTCAVHHLDVPWEPATLQQRNGRAVRQGNKEKVVALNYYLAEGSSDGLRLAAIGGKLGWMEELIRGSDRETNNPAAMQDFSSSELTLALSRDPTRLEGMKAALAAENRREDLSKAVKNLPRWVNHVRGLVEDASRAVDPVDASRQRALALEEWERVKEKAPPELAFQVAAASKVVFSRPVQAVGATLIWPGLRVVLEHEGGVEFGRSSSGDIVLRRANRAVWENLPRSLLAGGWEAVVEGETAVLKLPIESHAYDVALDEPNLAEVVTRYARRKMAVSADWVSLGWSGASSEFMRDTWSTVGDFVVDRVRAFRGPPLPGIRNGSLALVTGDDIDGVSIIPWTDEGYDLALQLPLAEEAKLSDIAKMSLLYWGRPFRRTRDVKSRTQTQTEQEAANA